MSILKYRALNSNVYSCFLDASKAFDSVNHSKVFDTLVKRGVPLYIIRLIRFWYTSQTMYVRWNTIYVMSSGFKVTNGVRQGGILSPYLFCVAPPYILTPDVKAAWTTDGRMVCFLENGEKRAIVTERDLAQLHRHQ